MDNTPETHKTFRYWSSWMEIANANRALCPPYHARQLSVWCLTCLCFFSSHTTPINGSLLQRLQKSSKVWQNKVMPPITSQHYQASIHHFVLMTTTNDKPCLFSWKSRVNLFRKQSMPCNNKAIEYA